jgi:aspartate carbamoyltransferase catalytic subunit
MMPDISIQVELKTGVDALYVTRLQQERLPATAEGKGLKDGLPSGRIRNYSKKRSLNEIKLNRI